MPGKYCPSPVCSKHTDGDACAIMLRIVWYEDCVATCLESVGRYMQLIEDDERALVLNELLHCSNLSVRALCDFRAMGPGSPQMVGELIDSRIGVGSTQPNLGG